MKGLGLNSSSIEARRLEKCEGGRAGSTALISYQDPPRHWHHGHLYLPSCLAERLTKSVDFGVEATGSAFRPGRNGHILGQPALGRAPAGNPAAPVARGPSKMSLVSTTRVTHSWGGKERRRVLRRSCCGVLFGGVVGGSCGESKLKHI